MRVMPSAFASMGEQSMHGRSAGEKAKERKPGWQAGKARARTSFSVRAPSGFGFSVGFEKRSLVSCWVFKNRGSRVFGAIFRVVLGFQLD